MNYQPSPAFLRALLRDRFDYFVQRIFQDLNNGDLPSQSWLLGAMAWQLQQVADGDIKRLIINVPPRHLKSITTSVAFPAFVLGHNPATTLILVCYSLELAAKMMQDLRRVMSAKRYRDLFPDTQLSRNNALEIVTTTNGGVLATSIEGTLTGRGADYIVIDDPMKPATITSEAERKRVNEWFSNTLVSRLNDKQQGRIVITMQRLHEDDLVGHLLDRPDNGWTVLKVPAIATQATAVEPMIIEVPHLFVRSDHQEATCPPQRDERRQEGRKNHPMSILVTLTFGRRVVRGGGEISHVRRLPFASIKNELRHLPPARRPGRRSRDRGRVGQNHGPVRAGAIGQF